MHLTVSACYRTVFLKHDGSVMIESCGPFLEERGDDDYTKLLSQLAVELRRRTRNGLGEVEVVDVFCLAEVERVVQFLEHDELCTPFGEIADALCQAEDVVFGVSSVVLLQESDIQFFHIVIYYSSFVI